MSFKTIMVGVDGGAASKARLALAARLAARWKAKLTAVSFAVAEAPVVFADAYSAGMFDVAADAARQAAEGYKSMTTQALAGADCDWEARVSSGFVSAVGELTARESLYADLCILPTPSAAEDSTLGMRMIQGVLFDGAGPVLAVPGDVDPDAALGANIALAWDARREAARAAQAARPLLAEAQKLEALTVRHFWGSEPYGPVPGLAFTQWLSRHGPTAELIELEGGDVATLLLETISARRHDLLVMGAYGHSRMREAFFGGVTETLLKQVSIPMLLAH